MELFYLLLIFFACVQHVQPQKFEGLSLKEERNRIDDEIRFSGESVYDHSLVGYESRWCNENRERTNERTRERYVDISSGNRICWISWRSYSMRNWNMPMKRKVSPANRCTTRLLCLFELWKRFVFVQWFRTGGRLSERRRTFSGYEHSRSLYRCGRKSS